MYNNYYFVAPEVKQLILKNLRIKRYDFTAVYIQSIFTVISTTTCYHTIAGNNADSLISLFSIAAV